MTPEDRYQLQVALAALEEAASAIRHVLDIGTNPHLPDDYAARLREGVSGMKQCICDFGWQPECPQHRASKEWFDSTPEDHQQERPPARTGVKVKPMFPAPTPEQEAEQDAAAQRLDAAIRAEKSGPVNPAKANHNRLLIRSHLPGIEHFTEPPVNPEPHHPPTPKDVFGGRRP